MIEYVVMDYDGEPVTVENGDIREAEPPTELWNDRREEYRGGKDMIYWDSDACEWTLEPYNEPCGNDRELYGLGWYDCNTDWRNW